MQAYKRVVGICIGLSVSLLNGGLCALFLTPSSDWYGTLTVPEMNVRLHEFIWLLCYLGIAFLIEEYLVARSKLLWTVLLSVVINILWCIVFFCLHDVASAMAVLLIQVLIYTELSFFAIKGKEGKNLILLPMLAWYCYLFLLNFSIVLSCMKI